MAGDQTSEVLPVNAGHEIVHSDRSLEDEQLSTRPFFAKNKNYENGGRFKFKMNIFFMATTHKLFHLDKRRFVQLKIVEISSSFI
jgi:hypothetical protein